MAVRTPRPRIALRWFVAVAATVAILLGLAAALVLRQERHVTLRIFNETPVPLRELQYSYSSDGSGEASGRFVESETGVTTEILMPGGTVSWEIEPSGQTEIVFSCSTPEGTAERAHVTVNIRRGDPSLVDLHITPLGVRAVVSGEGKKDVPLKVGRD
jgi:hypothetical protein